MSDVDFEIRAPSRLHFGLLSFGRDDRPQYGGLGVMVERPGLSLRATKSKGFAVSGPLSERLLEFATAWQRETDERLPEVKLELASEPAQHVGLGTGTQLGLAVAAALFESIGKQVPPAEEMAQLVGRAKRSSVGTYGFDRGGLIYETGKRGDQPIGTLKDHVELPQGWCVTLITPTQSNVRKGLSGFAEQQAFGQLPSVPDEATETLMDLSESCILPAAKRGDFVEFSEGIYKYGVTAGECFVEAQGGPFATKELAECVAAIRRRGIAGVGQSSWGPTLFAFCQDPTESQQLAEWCREELPNGDSAEIRVTPIARSGARRFDRGL